MRNVPCVTNLKFIYFPLRLSNYNICMTFYSKRLGIYGERVACRYLLDKGHKIIASNIVLEGGEIDILAIKDGILSINEVKTANLKAKIQAEENLSYQKVVKLRKLANKLKLNRNSLSKEGVVLPVFSDITINGICVFVDTFFVGNRQLVQRVKLRFYENIDF